MIDCKLAQKEGFCKVADCCGIVPFPNQVFEKNRSFTQRQIIEILPMGEEVIPVTEDLLCVFRKPDLSCAIYEERPSVCRLFGYIPDLQCPYCKISGSLRSEAKRKQIQRQINHNVTAQLKKWRLHSHEKN